MSAAAATQATCPRCLGPLEQGDLRCALCALAIPPAASSIVTAAAAKVVRCEGCGAAVSYDVQAKAPKCAFCGSVMHVEAVEDPLEQAEAKLPFTVDPSTAQEALQAWLKTRGFFRPSDLASESTVSSLQPLWWPAWVFDARGEVTWTADSNAGSRRSAWAPHAGSTEMSFDEILVPASRGLTESECISLAPYFNSAHASPNAPGPEGALTEQFDVQRSAARQRILVATESVAVQRLKSGVIPGSSFRNIHVSIVLRGLRTRRLSMPTYVLAYKYKGKLYRALVHGQDASAVFGSSPLSWVKVIGVSLAALAVLALLLLIFAR